MVKDWEKRCCWTCVQVQERILKLKLKLGNYLKPSYQPNSQEFREEGNPKGRDNKPWRKDQRDYYRMVGQMRRRLLEENKKCVYAMLVY